MSEHPTPNPMLSTVDNAILRAAKADLRTRVSKLPEPRMALIVLIDTLAWVIASQFHLSATREINNVSWGLSQYVRMYLRHGK